jgi:hypothetical protein
MLCPRPTIARPSPDVGRNQWNVSGGLPAPAMPAYLQGREARRNDGADYDDPLTVALNSVVM